MQQVIGLLFWAGIFFMCWKIYRALKSKSASARAEAKANASAENQAGAHADVGGIHLHFHLGDGSASFSANADDPRTISVAELLRSRSIESDGANAMSDGARLGEVESGSAPSSMPALAPSRRRIRRSPLEIVE